MDKNTKVNNDAFDKAQSKLYNLRGDIIRQKEEIRTGGDGTIPLELLKTCLQASERQLVIWEYINELIWNDMDHEIPTQKAWDKLQTKYDLKQIVNILLLFIYEVSGTTVDKKTQPCIQ